MNTLLAKLNRLSVLGLLFWLPRRKKILIERWLRGRHEYLLLNRSDAVIVSFGKSGRTWLRVMLSRFYQVQHGLPERMLISFDNMHRRNHAIPRLFFTHDNYLKDYTGNRSNKADFYGRKVVLLVRHPLDVAVSQFFQWKYRMRPGKKVINNYPKHGAEISIYDFVMHPAGLPRIIEYLNLWASEADRVGQLLIVRYEDLRADSAGELRRILEFIGTPGSSEEIAEAVRFASVENMRRMERKRTFWLAGSRMVPRDRANPNSYKVRKAKVGGYRDYFDEEQTARLEQVVRESLSPRYGYQAPAPDQSDTVAN